MKKQAQRREMMCPRSYPSDLVEPDLRLSLTPGVKLVTAAQCRAETQGASAGACAPLERASFQPSFSHHCHCQLQFLPIFLILTTHFSKLFYLDHKKAQYVSRNTASQSLWCLSNFIDLRSHVSPVEVLEFIVDSVLMVWGPTSKWLDCALECGCIS